MMNRRLWLTRIVKGFSITGAGFLAFPFFRALIPTADNETSLEVSVDDLRPGQSKIVRWRGRDLVIQKRSQEMIKTIEEGSIDLKDPSSLQSLQPAFAENEYRSLRPEIFVTYNLCTHLGCQVVKSKDTSLGFSCPCHQSDYDLSGRVLSGAAAPTNLEVPAYRFISGNILVLEVVEV
ncbi:ubiquinol-cytochrome c reductase iron-sulfur subunit [Pseudomonadales bacterium]|nr:ubiquinol-cytochrome c reductase iron-sulfur subunit [Pseudomonadales bacterium]MDG1002230.1 ubiquinol-cytochrome c reductase iron-sulfur subunit [Pseudomonadales bacterium]MDG1909092.1 ubiquinol-cytochrome c reductase iron-sulfur subunit [Pseudomonadales bacterium]|tara:strand:- start:635 stop:1168 length:534 start_codon:yes stop_codon:yes gene_type:complete